MCSCRITRVPLTGSAKGQGGWIGLSTAAVCFEHTQHACLEEALCVDLFDATLGTRIALELDAASARRLAGSPRRSWRWSAGRRRTRPEPRSSSSGLLRPARGTPLYL